MSEPNKISDSPSNPVKIEIALPCYGSKFDAITAFSLMNLMVSWKDRSIDFTYSTIDICDVELARNLLITNFYFARADSTHILFIDNDLGFSVGLIDRMINLGESVVGVGVPKRDIDLQMLHGNSGIPFTQALARSINFVVNDASASAQNSRSGFVEVDSCGTGIMLISRECIKKMTAACPELKVPLQPDDFRKKALAPNVKTFLMPFNKIISQSEYLSEDCSFCRRWTEQCGGKIFVNTDAYVQHVSKQIISSRIDDLS